MKFLKFVYLVLVVIVLANCKKKEYNSIYNIRYQVRVMPKNKASIGYYSDLYHQSGELKKIIIDDSTNVYHNNTWFATRRKPVVNEDYFIEVNFEEYDNPNKERHGVFVFVNDTSLIDSFTTISRPSKIVLKGKIPTQIE